MKPLTGALIASLAISAVAALAADVKLKPGTYASSVDLQAPGMPQSMKMAAEEECLTEEQARDPIGILMKAFKDMEDCAPLDVKTTGNQIRFEMRCKVDGELAVGKTEMTFGGDWYKGVSTMSMGGTVVTMKVEGKWVRAGCPAGK